MDAKEEALYGITRLSAAECWEAIRGADTGRLGVVIDEILETVALPIFPWQAGTKSRYVRIVPTEVTGRRFRVQASAGDSRSISGMRRPNDPS